MAITILILLTAVAILAWGFYRARPFGKFGILAWLQSAVLMAPWLIFFGLFAAGVYLNLASVLLLIVISTGLYIFLGRQLREAGKDELLAKRMAAIASKEETGASEQPEGETASSQAAPTVKPDLKLPVPEIEPIPTEDLMAVKGIFGIDTFFATETIPYQDGVIFKGNLRGEAAHVQQHLTALMEERLGDRYRLFLVEGAEGRPVVVVLPSKNDPKPLTPIQKAIAATLAIATAATVFETSAFLLGFDLFETPERLSEVLPIGLSILSILVAHELGHWILAKQHQVKLNWPFFLPALQIGSFGALTRFESLLLNRSVLFDVAIAGPAAGGLLSLGMLVIGLVLSHPGSLFQIPVEFFQGSILVGTLSKAVLGSALQEPLVDVHPLTVIGWLGLVINALNLMPAGQLDGGRIVQAIYGRKVAGRATIATLIVLGLASLVNPLALYWAVIILFLQRNLERPSLDELTEPDDARAALGLLALFLMVATLLPLTPSLAGRLGIGG